jgi:hypothetical protein
MKKSMLLLSSFTAINGLSLISCQTLKSENENNTALVFVETHKLPGVDMQIPENDELIFRHKMNKRIDASSQSLATLRTKIKEEKKGNADISTTIFELELANGYMKLKLEKYQQHEKGDWEVFKRQFNKEMNNWTVELAEFESNI